ncbi:MAG: hypothetical protein QXE68_07230 [Sulfolobales archaeon]
MGLACDLYDKLSDDARKNIVKMLVFYVANERVSSGGLEDAFSFVERVVKAGFTDKDVEKLYNHLGTYVDAVRSISAVPSAIEFYLKDMDLRNLDRYDKLVSDIENAASRLASLGVPSDLVYVASDLKLVRDFLVDIAELGRLGDKISEAFKSGDPEKISRELPKISGDISSLYGKVYTHYNRIMVLAKTDVGRSLAQNLFSSLTSTLKNIESYLSKVKSINDMVLDINRNMRELSELINSIGSDDTKTFFSLRGSIMDRLRALMIYDKKLMDMINVEKDENIKRALLDIDSGITKALIDLKKETLGTDPRWVDLWRTLEKEVYGDENYYPVGFASYEEMAKAVAKAYRSQYEKFKESIPPNIRALFEPLLALVDIAVTFNSKLMELIGKYGDASVWFDKMMKDMYEKAALALSSGDPRMKILGALGAFGAGAGDVLTMLFRPRFFMENLQALAELASTAVKKVHDKGIQGAIEFLRDVGKMMCGSINRCLYTAGNIAGAVALAGITPKLGLSPRVSSAVTDLALGDPLSAVIRLIGAEKVLLRLRLSVEEKAVKISESSKVFNSDNFFRALYKYSLQFLGETPHLSKIVDALKKSSKEMISKFDEINKAVEISKTLAMKYGINELVEHARNIFSLYNDVMPKEIRMKDILESIEARSKKYVPLKVQEKEISAVHPPKTEVSARVEAYANLSLKRKPIDLAIQRISLKKPEIKLMKEISYIEKKYVEIQSLKIIKDMSPKLSPEVDKVLSKAEFTRNLVENIKKVISHIESEVKPAVKSIESVEALVRKLSSGEISPAEFFKEAEGLLKAKLSPEDLKAVENALKEGRIGDALNIINEKYFGKAVESAVQSVREAVSELRDWLKESGRRIPEVEDLLKELDKIKSVDDLKKFLNEKLAVKLANALERAGIDLLSDVEKLFKLTLKDPEARRALESFLSTYREMVMVKAPELKLTAELSAEVRDVARKLAGDPNIGKMIPEEDLRILQYLASADVVTLGELQKLTEIIARNAPRIAGVAEIKHVVEGLSHVISRVEELLGDSPLVSTVRSLKGVVGEISTVVSKSATVVKTGVLEFVGRSTKEFMDLIGGVLEEVSPSTAERFRAVANEVLSEISRGDLKPDTVERFGAVLKEASDALKKAGYVMPSWKRIGYEVSRMIERYYEEFRRLVGKDVSLKSPEAVFMDLLRNTADEIVSFIQRAPELKEGWGFADIDVLKSEAKFIVINKELRDMILKLLSTGTKEVRAMIGDTPVVIRREIIVDRATSSLRVRYHLEFPDGRYVEAGFIVRRGAGNEIYRTYEIAMDPRLREEIAKAKTGKIPSYIGKLYELARDPEKLIELIDPDASLLKNIAVLDRGSMVSFFDLLKQSVALLSSYLALPAVVQAKDISAVLFAKSLSTDKSGVLELLKPVTDSSIPDELRSMVEAKGYIPVAWVNPSRFITDVIAPVLARMSTDERVSEFLKKFFSDPAIMKVLNLKPEDVSTVLRNITPESLRNLFKVIPAPTLLDVFEKYRASIEEILTDVTKTIDNIVVIAIPRAKPFLPDRDWVAFNLGDISIPIPVIGRWSGKSVTIIPLPSLNVLSEFGIPLKSLQSITASIPMITIRFPDIVVSELKRLVVGQAPPTPSTQQPPPPPAVVAVVPAGLSMQPGSLGAYEKSGEKSGYQRERLTILY